MSIGYACHVIGVPNTNMRRCLLKNASESKLLEITSYNLSSFENIIEYNIQNHINLFRISSDLIPFGSSEINNLPWWSIFEDTLSRIGDKIQKSNIRVSMHPGQYTVLNSPNNDVVTKCIADLNYHAKVLDSLGTGTKSKIVLHIGGIYNNKNQAITRFLVNYQMLDDAVKSRLVIENDDKSYNISDVLDIGDCLNIPVIFDNLHHKINGNDKQVSEFYWVDKCKQTWKDKDGNQKIHYSQQNPLKNPGSHSESIEINEFLQFYEKVDRKDIDIMLEVKDKNLSAVKCISYLKKNGLFY